MLIISGTLQTEVTCCNRCMTKLAEQGGNPQRDVMVSVEACHRALCDVGNDARIDKRLMPTIVRHGSFHSLPGQSIVGCNLANTPANTVQVRNNRPHRDAIALDTSGIQTGIMRVLLNIARHKLLIFHPSYSSSLIRPRPYGQVRGVIPFSCAY